MTLRRSWPPDSVNQRILGLSWSHPCEPAIANYGVALLGASGRAVALRADLEIARLEFAAQEALIGAEV